MQAGPGGIGPPRNSVRVGDAEKDGVVMNVYINHNHSHGSKSAWSRPKLGWHTDALRDIAYLRLPKPMLNFGLHLDTVDAGQGDAALCLLPGTHRQSLLSFVFRKARVFWGSNLFGG